MPRPNLFIVGAMKSGTSSLHAYLAEHPDVFMCEPKEPCYFVDPADYQWPQIQALELWGDEAAYLELFRSGAGCRVVGESSTLYTKAPKMPGVPARIAAFTPEARIIYLMRDPVERTLSHYWHATRDGKEQRDMLTAIREEPHFVEVSDYAMQLAPYIDLFGRDRVATFTLEEMKASPESVVRAIFEWLEVDPAFVPENLGSRKNVTPGSVDRLRGTGWLEGFRHSKLWNALGPLVPKSVRRMGRDMATESVDRASQSEESSRDYLRELQRPQVANLERMLGRSFPEWTSLNG